jgi:hypothetical protein
MRDDTETKPKAIHIYEDFTRDISPADFRTRYTPYTKGIGK